MKKWLICLLVVCVLMVSGCIGPPQRVTVPDVIGLDADDAHQEILDKSLVPYLIEGTHAPESNLEWIVYLQDPVAQKRVPRQSGVELTYYTPFPVQARRMSILGTCLPGSEYLWKHLGGTHFYGNAFDWPDYSLVRDIGLKVFVCISAEGPEDEAYVRMIVEQYKDDPVTGGYWNESMGHEPDIVGVSIEVRKWFYDLVRSIDPDKQNHPVMEMFNMTHKFSIYPGWEDAFSNETHDLLLFDCYPEVAHFDRGITLGFGFINEFADSHQAIPQMKAFFDEGEYMPDFLIKQYEAWKEKYQKFNNPYAPYVAVCFYKDQTIRNSADFQRQIKYINEETKK